MRASIWSGANRYVRRIYATILGDPARHRSINDEPLHIRDTMVVTNRTNRRDSTRSRKMALWMIPQLFAYALNHPIAKFLQAQSKIMVRAYIAGSVLVLHIGFSWLFMLKLGWGLAGGAVVLNLSWWFIVVAQLVYVFGGACGRAWSGFSWGAFTNLWSFVKLSLASAVMLW